MRRRRYVFMSILLMVALGTVTYYYRLTRTVSLADEEWNICEAVIRYQLNRQINRDTDTVYVEIQGLNPTAAFLDRFQEQRVKAGWRFSAGDAGVLLFIREIDHHGESTAEVSGGLYRGPRSAAGYTYSLERSEGRWVVSGHKMSWISKLPNTRIKPTALRAAAYP